MLEWLGAGVFFLCVRVQRERMPQGYRIRTPVHLVTTWEALGPNPVTLG